LEITEIQDDYCKTFKDVGIEPNQFVKYSNTHDDALTLKDED